MEQEPNPGAPWQMSRRGFLGAVGAVGALAALPALGSRANAGTPQDPLLPQAGSSDQPPASEPGLDQGRWEACMRAARDILLVGSQGEDLKLQYLKVLIDDGLPQATRPKKVLVVGAGMAGLAAGLLLKGAGHDVTIIEANGNRIGGRVKTFHADSPQQQAPPFSDPLQYGEAGAMRLPDFHPLTLALVDKLGLTRRLFYNVDITPGTGNQDAPIPAVTYQAYDGTVWRRGPSSTSFKAPDHALSTWINANDLQVRRRDYAQDPAGIDAGFGLPPDDAHKTTSGLLDAAVDPVRDYFSERGPGGERMNKQPVQALVEGWARLLYDLDHYSMWGFLKERAGLSDETIQAIGTLENLTSRLPLSFLHSFQDLAIINPQSTYWEIEGGSWRLPYALRPMLEHEIHMDRRMTRLEYWDPDRSDPAASHVGPDGPAVWIQTVSEDDALHKGLATPTEVFTGDVAIVAIPFSSLRHVEVAPSFSYRKRRAIIELHYDSATKVLLEFSRRWWEFSEDDWQRELEAVKPGLSSWYEKRRAKQRAGARLSSSGMLGAAVDAAAIPEAQKRFHALYATASPPDRPATQAVGGGSVSDNPNRFMYYPSHRVKGSEGGVVLASYVWADDACRWDSMDDDERYAYALRGLQEVHGERLEVFYTGSGQTQSWMRDPYAFGEAAVLAPGQLSQYQAVLHEPEGIVHFAGEHTSVKHAWIEGALESAVRAALEVSEEAAPAAERATSRAASRLVRLGSTRKAGVKAGA